MNTLIVFAAEYLIFVPVLIVAALVAIEAFRHRNWRIVAFVVLAGIISLVLAKLSGQLYSHPQPFATGGFEPLVPHDVDNSFPSDHTLLAAVLALSAIKIQPKIGWPLLVIAVLVALGRVGASLHYPIDVITSFVLAFIGAAVAYVIVYKLARKNSTKSPAANS